MKKAEIILLWWLCLFNWTCININESNKHTNEKLVETLTKQNNEKIYDIEENGIESQKIENLENKGTKTIYIDSIKDSPLFMPGTKRHIWEFLWYNQYEKILKEYNNIETIPENQTILDYDSIQFPLIFDWLESKLPNNVKNLLGKWNFEEYKDDIVDKNWDLIVICNIWTQWSEKFILWYYIEWKLYLATHTTIWKKNYTPDWLFRSWIKNPRNVSKKYGNSAMPYTILIKWNICMHQWKVTWEKLSHGCIRVPWLYQQEIYNKIKDWTAIIIKNEAKEETSNEE